jgi:hypothetical protein
MRRVDQTYTTIDISVDAYDEELIQKIKTLYPAIALARISATKFSTESANLLKFYVYHWLHLNHLAVIHNIVNYFNKYTISKKVVSHR